MLSRMIRPFLVTSWRLALLSVLALGCGSSTQTAPKGAVRLHTAIVDGQLFVDALPRGALADGQVVELPPGRHLLEVRRGAVVIASLEVEVRAALLLDATLREAEPSAAEPSAAELPTAEPSAAEPSAAAT